MSDKKYDELMDMVPITTKEQAEAFAAEIEKRQKKLKDEERKLNNLKNELKEWADSIYHEQKPDSKGKREPVRVGGVSMSFAKDSLNAIPYEEGEQIKEKFDDDDTFNQMLEPVWKPIRGCADVFDALPKYKQKLFNGFVKKGSGRLTT